MELGIISYHKINFSYAGKAYGVWVSRKHGVCSFPLYVIKFKSGTRNFHRWGKRRDKLYISSGNMLPADLVTAIDIAIHHQIELLLNQQALYDKGYFINEEYMKGVDRTRPGA